MKISETECSRACANGRPVDEKILPKVCPNRQKLSRESSKRELSPLEHGMMVAQAALEGVPDVREDIVRELKRRVEQGCYTVSGEEIAKMMLRRLAADRFR
ncbi:MAG: flagellar biosynthesis anti-sigma factor FlgM [Armatimonadota bacterium]